MKQVNLVLGVTIITLSILGMLNIVYGNTLNTTPEDNHVINERFTDIEDNCDLVCEINVLANRTAVPVMTTATR